MRHLVLTMFGLACFSGSVHAQAAAWANKLFVEGTTHDFGTVARGAQLKYSFPVKNIYKVPLEITNVRATCGCLTSTVSKNLLQPNETGSIDILMDGRRFNGPKTLNVYVTVGPEFISTATLTISANARQDVVLNPGEINFGPVQKGQTPTQILDVEYSGSLDWRIAEVIKNASAPFDLKVEELYRQAPKLTRAGKVGYRFSLTVKADAATGPFKQEIVLKTNDPASPHLSFTAEGNLQAALSVAPSLINFGNAKVGAKMETRKVQVRGNRPFKILSISGQGDGVTVDRPDREATSHVLTLKFQPTHLGEIRREIVIRTDLDNETVTIVVEANIQPGKEEGPAPPF